ncbi:hypothetical protein [Chlamydia buteonis]|uniref:Uncharacterized protein n=1 Tax=Chlamydia buteonis TaxID=2494525 RepID=A0ABX8L8X9_9CHLA|nr:hypothetical protein [Chlamydia buteonis]QXE27378.1 hypothetical protein HBN95_04545 [Chlamydia buteonis]QXE27724.1 hypothetical protein JJJ19_03655 [Chlamydia buteonis]
MLEQERKDVVFLSLQISLLIVDICNIDIKCSGLSEDFCSEEKLIQNKQVGKKNILS